MKKYYQKSITLILITVFIFTACASTTISGMQVARADDRNEDEPITEAFFKNNDAVEVNKITGEFKIPEINAQSAIVIDKKTKRVLFEKDAYSKRNIASTTKIITCIVALENSKMEDVVTISRKAADVWGSDIKLKAGQKFTMRELLYGLMLKSGNDAAMAIAEQVGGSEEGFVSMMNKKAKEIGAENTSFSNPHGLDEDGHYSTAYDMAIITAYALENNDFSIIVSTKQINFPSLSLANTNEMLTIYPNADGVKTGYTGIAGRCLVTSANYEDMKLISVVLNCATREKRALSSKTILEYASKKYHMSVLLKKGDVIGDIPVIKGRKEIVTVKAANEIVMPLSDDEVSKIEKKVSMDDVFHAPLDNRQKMGTVSFTAGDMNVGKVDIETDESVEKKNFMDFMIQILESLANLVRGS